MGKEHVSPVVRHKDITERFICATHYDSHNDTLPEKFFLGTIPEKKEAFFLDEHFCIGG
jgi:hypothetical protein